MKIITQYLFSKTIGRFFCFLWLYVTLIVNSQAAGFVDVSGIQISASPVIIGQNFDIHFYLREYRNDLKNFEYIKVLIKDKNMKDVFTAKQWDNVSFSARQELDFKVTTYLYSNRSPGSYFIVVRGKEYGGEPFDFGVVPNNYGYATLPYKFSAISPIKADVVFSNYGPGNSTGSFALPVGRTLLFKDPDFQYQTISVGMPFTVPWKSSFKLDSVSVTVGYGFYWTFSDNSIPANLIISVNEDSNGFPGAVLEQFTFSNTKFNSLWGDRVLLTGISDRHPTLSVGTRYWLTAGVSDSRISARWFGNNQNSIDSIAWRFGSESWVYFVTDDLGAFRVIGTPISNPQKLQPEINSISPESGLAGTTVTIKGNKFGATQGGSLVRFGSVQAVVNSWSDNKIEAVAPSGSSGSVPVSVMTATGISNVNKMFTYSVQPNITLNIQRVPILKEQNFKNYEVQLQYELLDVASSETQKLGEDCYTGTMSAVAVNQAGQIAKLALSTIASSIIETSIGLITTANLYGDYLLKFSAKIAGSLIQENPFDEAVIKFVAENTMGYIAGKATNNFYAGEFIEELNQSVVEKLLKNDGGLNWVIRGNNTNSRYYTSKLVPLTEVDSQFYYNPYTHYTTGIVRATCYPEGSSMRKQLYTISYRVDETKYHSAEIVAGTLVIRLMNLN